MLAIFQFDSAARSVVEEMLADGRLPVLADLKRRGRWEPIDGRTTILQSSTYPTVCTGVDVREHGIYSAVPWSAADQRPRFMQSFPRPQTIWERLTARGRKSLVIDPYLSWPPASMAGVFLSGWQFRDRMVLQGHAVPGATQRSLERRHGRAPRLDDVYGTKQGASLLRWRDELIKAPGRVADAAVDLLAQESFDLVWLTFGAAHKAGHHLWDPAAVSEEPLSDQTQRTLQGGLAEVYAAIDRAMGRVLAVLPEGTDVIAFTPTGMGPNTSRADLLPGMLDAVLAGEAGREARPAREPRTGIWNLRSLIPAEWRDWVARTLPDEFVADLTTRLYTRLDWTKTRAIALPGENKGYIRVNLRGREREGIVDPAESPELMATIARGLMTFQDPDGTPSITKVEPISEIASTGAAIDRLPDLVVHWGARSAARLPNVTSPEHGQIVRRGVGSGRSGNHDDDAWAIVLPGASRHRDLGRSVRITDIGTTACSLFDADLAGLSGASLLERI